MVSREHGMRNGHLDFLDWDQAVVDHICAELDPDNNQYFLNLNGIFIGENPVNKALVVYKRPEPTQVEMDLPLVVLNRDDVVPAPERLYSVTEQYRVPTEGAQVVSASNVNCLGFTSYETKDQERPYDFIYTIEVWSRYRAVAQMMLAMMMAKFPLRGSIDVTDSLQCVRTYAAYQEGVADLTEVLSLVDRVPGFALTVRLEGELTLDRMPIDIPAFTGERGNTPNDPDDPDPGPGGLYGTGLADITIDVIDNC